MAYRIVWSPRAALDLKEIRDYIAEDDPQSARHLVKGVFSSIQKLSSFPNSGRKVPEFNNPAIREVIRKPCRIIYRVQASHARVEIARIWYAARGAPVLSGKS